MNKIGKSEVAFLSLVLGVILAGLVVAATVYVFAWAGVPTMTACGGFAPLLVIGLLVLACVYYILPYISKRK